MFPMFADMLHNTALEVLCLSLCLHSLAHLLMCSAHMLAIAVNIAADQRAGQRSTQWHTSTA